jgi:antitoxin ParD1/3/4
MNVSLTPQLEALIKEQVESGMYSNASEVVRDALRQFFREAEERRKILKRFHAEIQKGFDQLERGEISNRSLDEIFEDAMAKAQALEAKRAAS